MKKIYTLLLCLLTVGFMNAQEILFQDDFESYEANAKVAQSADGTWTTWSDAPGGGEDATVSEAQAASGTKSMYCVTNTDMIYNIFDTPVSSGRYIVKFKMLVEEGKEAYWNILHEFDGANSEWAVQSFYRPSGAALTDADGAGSSGYDFVPGEWFDVDVVIDLDDDFSTYYALKDETVSWPWSAGTFGSGSIRTMQTINFYGWTENATGGFYIDDVVVTRVEKPGAALNLNAVITDDNQIQIDWENSDEAEKYILTSGAENLLETTANSYLIEKPYPQEFDFAVGAHYDLLGYRFSEPVNLDLPGGKARDYVIFEAGTGTWCVNCPSTSRGFDDMHAEGLPVGIVEYHNGDSYVNEDGTARINYYGINGFPTSYRDGGLAVRGGSRDGNQYEQFKGLYDARMERRSLYTTDVAVEETERRTLKVDVTSSELFSYFDGPLTLQVAVVESGIEENWHGLNDVNFILRKMYPSHAGTTLNYVDGVATVSMEIELPESMDANQSELVVFIQDEESKEILNGYTTTLSTIVGLEEIAALSYSVTPNPTSDIIEIKGLSGGTGYLYNMSGQMVKKFTLTPDHHTESLSELNSGVYLLSVINPEGQATRKIMKR